MTKLETRKEIRMELRLAEQHAAMVDEMASKGRRTKAEVIRMAIEELYRQQISSDDQAIQPTTPPVDA